MSTWVHIKKIELQNTGLKKKKKDMKAICSMPELITA